MKITCADFITKGDYSMNDIKEYLSALKQKWNEKGVWDRQPQKHVDETSEKINATLLGITRSYEDLLENIDKYQHPRLHEAVKNGIVKLKKCHMKSAIIQGEIGSVRNELAKLMDCVATIHALTQSQNGGHLTITIIYDELAGKSIQLNENTDTYLIGDH